MINDFGTPRFGDLVHEDLDLVVVLGACADPEDAGRFHLADGVALAEVEIRPHAHGQARLRRR